MRWSVLKIAALSSLVLGAYSAPARAQGDGQDLPCNEACRAWMGPAYPRPGLGSGAVHAPAGEPDVASQFETMEPEPELSAMPHRRSKHNDRYGRDRDRSPVVAVHERWREKPAEPRHEETRAARDERAEARSGSGMRRISRPSGLELDARTRPRSGSRRTSGTCERAHDAQDRGGKAHRTNRRFKARLNSAFGEAGGRFEDRDAFAEYHATPTGSADGIRGRNTDAIDRGGPLADAARPSAELGLWPVRGIHHGPALDDRIRKAQGRYIAAHPRSSIWMAALHHSANDCAAARNAAAEAGDPARAAPG